MDAFGRPVQIPRDQFRTQMLPEMLKSHGNDPDRLAAVILQGLQFGMAADVLFASNRLSVIDPDPERSLSLLAAVQREVGELEAATSTLQELLQKRPQSCAARVGLALLADRGGDAARAETLLWEALAIDPNHADALNGWLQVRQRQVGEALVPAEIERAAALPNAFRARLFVLGQHLRKPDLAAAERICRELVQSHGSESDVLRVIAAEMGKVGRHDLVAELVLPNYALARHHPEIGLSLLGHYVATRQPERGQELLHQLRMQFPRVLDQHLVRFDAEFARLAAPATPQIPSGPAKVSLYRIDRPLWLAGLDDPQWLLPPKQADAPVVVFAALAVAGATENKVQREDENGRLSRSLPLFLAEQFWLSSPLLASVALPVADLGGWVLTAQPWPEEKLAEMLQPDERARDRIVTGSIRMDGDQRRLDLWVYDCKTKQRQGHATATAAPGQLGAAVLQLLAELSPLVGGPAGLKPPVGEPAWWERYVAGLGQHAALVVAHMGAMPKDRLFGQRSILEWLLTVALDEPRWQPARFLFASAVCTDAALGSKIHKEMAQPMAELFRMEPAQTPFARLAVKPLHVLGLQGAWHARRHEIVPQGGDASVAWIRRIESGGKLV